MIVVMEELWGGHCHCPKFQFHNDQTSEYVSTHNSHNTFFVTFLHKAMISNGEVTKEIVKVSKSVVVLLQSNGSKSVESGRVCIFVT